MAFFDHPFFKSAHFKSEFYSLPYFKDTIKRKPKRKRRKRKE